MSKQSRQPKPATGKQLQHSAETIENFVRYLSSPWRIIWTNFVAGIFRGLGAIVGAAIVIAATIWILGFFVNIPLIGKYAEKIEGKVKEYTDETNYNQEFDSLGDSLERIESALSTSPALLTPHQSTTTDTSDNTGITPPASKPDQSQGSN